MRKLLNLNHLLSSGLILTKNNTMKSKLNWIIEGLIAGVIFLVIIILVDLISGDFSLEGIWKKIFIFLIAGIGYGLTMKYYRRKGN